jgi:hypothetical protein
VGKHRPAACHSMAGAKLIHLLADAKVRMLLDETGEST